jgi:hypothetical protein
MAQIPGVHIETLGKPADYSQAEIDLACKLAFRLNRGKLVLCAPADEPS